MDEERSHLIHSLEEILESLSHESETLFDEARKEARAEAKQIIKDLLIRNHLERARARLSADAEGVRFEPDATEHAAVTSSGPPRTREHVIASPDDPGGETFLYAYGVIEASQQIDLSPLVSITGSRDLRLHRVGRTAAIVGPVGAAEFGSAALKRNLEDFEWLESRARAHESVLSEVLERTDVIPFRFLTIFRDDSSIEGMLAERQHRFTSTLETLKGKVEMGVKLYVSPTQLREWVRGSDDRIVPLRPAVGQTGPGRSYFADRKAEERVAVAADDLIEESARLLYRACGDLASDSKILRPQNKELSGRSDPMVLNAGYLVDRESAGPFERRVAKVGSDLSDKGFDIEVTGPWPPHNFVPEEDVVG